VTKRELAIREIERGEILRYLAIAYPDSATPKMLLYHLRDIRYPVTDRMLAYHLEYLAQKGWVAIDYATELVGQERHILAVAITPAGIDLHDRRKAGDTGVKL
jgi:hypothetical protein